MQFPCLVFELNNFKNLPMKGRKKRGNNSVLIGFNLMFYCHSLSQWPAECVVLNDLTIGWQNLNPLSHLNTTLATQARQARASGENLNYLLNR